MKMNRKAIFHFYILTSLSLLHILCVHGLLQSTRIEPWEQALQYMFYIVRLR